MSVVFTRPFLNEPGGGGGETEVVTADRHPSPPPFLPREFVLFPTRGPLSFPILL